MRKLFPAFFCFFLYPSIAAAAPGAVRCAHLLDVRSGEIRDDQTIVFAADGTVTSVGSAKSAALPANVTPIEISGTCLPGLIDVHTHVTFNPEDEGYAGLGVSIPREAIAR